MSFKKLALAAVATSALLLTSAYAEGIKDPNIDAYYQTFKGKTIAFVPVAMGFDLTEGWAAGIRQQTNALGMKFEVRDPNWSTAAGAQAITSLIAEKPSVMVIHNPDVQSYAHLLRKAQAAGIYVVQVNMESSFPTDAYVGADWHQIGATAAQAVVKACGTGSGKSGKVAIVQGVLTAAASAYQVNGVYDVLSKHPEIKIVSNQAGDWDASKARSITATVLQQNPDLCGIIGFWDGMDTGTAAAIKEAGKTGLVFLVTSGGGADGACTNVENGTFSEDISYDVPGQARDMNNMIKTLLESHLKPGTLHLSLYTPLKIITKADMTPTSCWNLKALQKAATATD